MKKKLFYFILVLCLIKLYDIAYRSLNFSPNLLINSFNHKVGEKISLGKTADDLISLKEFFLNKNVLNYKLSEEILENYEVYYQGIVEFVYPIKLEQKASTLVALKVENTQKNCELLHFTKNLNVYECE